MNFFENQEVLHFSISDRSYEEDRSKTVAVISGISKDEWILSRNKFTFLSPVLYDINNTKIYVLPSNVGEDYLIDNNKWKGWLFDRGIFVQKISNITLGAFDLKLRLDRNRNVVIDDSNLKEQISKGILWVLQALKLKNQQEYQVFLNRIYTLLAKNSFEVEKIQNYITTPTANDLFELFLNLHGITAQPCTEYQNDEIEEAKKLGVAMVGVKSQLMGCLIKSHLYKPITSITHAATQVKLDYTPTRGEMNVVERVADLVPDMTLKFKCGLSVDTSLQKRTLYISSNLLNQDHVHKEKKGLCLHIIEGKCMCREINLIWRIAMRLKLGEDKITSKILSLR